MTDTKTQIGAATMNADSARTETDQLRAALDELLAVKDLRKKVREAFFNGDVDIACRLDDEYDRREPLAWEVARRLREKT